MDEIMNRSLETEQQRTCKKQRLWKKPVAGEIMHMDFYNGYKTGQKVKLVITPNDTETPEQRKVS